MIKPKGHVPDLTRKNCKNTGALYPKQTSGKERHKSCDRNRQKSEDRHRLQNVHHRQDDGSGSRTLCGGISSTKCEQERDPHPEHGPSRVVRNVPDIGRYLERLILIEVRRHPAAEMQNCPKQSKDSNKNDNVDPAETARCLLGTELCCRRFHLAKARYISEPRKTDNEFRVKV